MPDEQTWSGAEPHAPGAQLRIAGGTLVTERRFLLVERRFLLLNERRFLLVGLVRSTGNTAPLSSRELRKRLS